MIYVSQVYKNQLKIVCSQYETDNWKFSILVHNQVILAQKICKPLNTPTRQIFKFLVVFNRSCKWLISD